MNARRHSFRSLAVKPSSGVHTPANPPAIETTPGSGIYLLTPAPPAGFPHDLACGILVGIIEAAGVVVTPDAITLTDPATGKTKVESPWLKTDSPFGALALECFQARLKMMAPTPQRSRTTTPWQAARAVRERDEAAATYRTTRQRVHDVLKQRGTLGDAERRRFRVLIEG